MTGERETGATTGLRTGADGASDPPMEIPPTRFAAGAGAMASAALAATAIGMTGGGAVLVLGELTAGCFSLEALAFPVEAAALLGYSRAKVLKILNP